MLGNNPNADDGGVAREQFLNSIVHPINLEILFSDIISRATAGLQKSFKTTLCCTN